MATLCLLAIALLPGIQARSEDIHGLYHNRWTIREGAPRNIKSIAAGDDGFLWVGTDHGLFRFDGLTFEAYSPDPESAKTLSQDIAVLNALPSGLWIGYEAGGASVLFQGHVTTYGKREGLLNGTVRSIAEVRDGSVWAATDFSLYRFDGRRWFKQGFETHFPNSYPNSIYADSHGTLWANTYNGLVYLPKGDATFHSADRHVSQNSDFSESPDGTVWFASRIYGVRAVSSKDGRYINSKLRFNYESSGILVDASGALWITTVGRGLFRVDLSSVSGTHTLNLTTSEQLMERDGLTANFPIQAVSDREGSVWVASTKGIDQFHKSRFTPVPLAPGSEYIALGLDKAGGLVIGSQQTFRAKKGRLKGIPAGPMHAECVYTDTQGGTWIGNRDGLWLISGERLIRYSLPFELKGDPRQIQAITMDRDQRLWISFVGLGLYRFDRSSWTRPGLVASLPSGPPVVETTAGDGSMWFGYASNEIASVLGDLTREFTLSDGLDLGVVSSIADIKGQLWVGGHRGLEFLKGSRFFHVNLNGTTALEGVSGIVEGISGDLWLNTANGILRLAGSDLQAALEHPEHAVTFDQFTYLDGIEGTPEQIRPLPSAIRRSDGRLYFATRANVMWIDPRRVARNQIVPTVAIQSVSAAGKQYSSSSDITFPKQTSDLLIRYTASSLMVPGRARFRYRLEGVDAGWQDAGTVRQATYTRLLPGHYTFRVMACNDDGVWNLRGTSLDFYIPPTFFQRTSFKVFCALTAVSFLWLLYWIRIQQVTKSVQVRLLERVAEREHIARELHDTFLQGIQGLILSFHTATALVPKDQPSRRMLDDALAHSDRVLREGRGLVTQLRGRPRQFDELSNALASVGNEMGKGQPAEFRLIVTGLPCDMHPVVRDDLYQIGREAVCNAFRHADATFIEVELVYGSKDFCLAVRDDGRGIDPAVIAAGAREDHWGLPGIRERAKKIGATLDLRSGPLGGTKVEVRIPARLAYNRVAQRHPKLFGYTFGGLRGGHGG